MTTRLDPPPVERVDFASLVRRHRGVLLDAYGVLVDASGVLAGAREAIALLTRERIPYRIVTNDASRLPAAMAARFATLGLEIPESCIVSAGSLLPAWFAANGVHGARCAVLGTQDSRRYVEAAGGIVVEPDDRGGYDVVVLCDEHGYPLLSTMDCVLTELFRALERGSVPRLVLPNPDCAYPKAGGAFGHGAGAVAAMLESALRARDVARAPLRFERLGKPERRLFDAACEQLGTRDVVAIGDQLLTDIAGAHRAGLPSALIGTGVSKWSPTSDPATTPTYLLHDLSIAGS